MADTQYIAANYIYFYHLNQWLALPMYPEDITDTMQSNFQQTNALARSAPVFTYSNSGPRSMSITLDMHRDMFNEENEKLNTQFNTYGEDYVDALINHLQACALPNYQSYSTSTASIVPPMIAINFGDSIFIKGVVNSTVTVTYKKPILTNYKGQKKYAHMVVNFTVFETEPFSAQEVVKAGSFRGLAAGNVIKTN